MSVRVQIPTPLRRFAGEAAEMEVEASTVGEALKQLVERHQALKRHLYTDDGSLRSFVNVFLNDENIRYLNGEKTEVKDGDVLTIIPSIAGG